MTVTVWPPLSAAPQTTPRQVGGLLPSSPSDGQEVVYVVTTASQPNMPNMAEALWRFRYSQTATRWEFVGGSPAISFLSTDVAGPTSWGFHSNFQFATPFPLLVRAEVQGVWFCPGGSTAFDFAPDNGVPTDYGQTNTPAANIETSFYYQKTLGLGSGGLVQLWTFCGAAHTVRRRRIIVTPIYSL